MQRWRCAGPVAGSHGGERTEARARGSTAKKSPSALCMHAEAGVERATRRTRLGLRFEAVDLGRVGHVELEAEGRERRIADDDLEVRVVVVEAVSCVRRWPSEASRLPADLVARYLFRVERRGNAEADRDVQAARAEAGGDEGIEEVVVVDWSSSARPCRRSCRTWPSDLVTIGSAVLDDVDVVGGARCRCSARRLELEAVGEVEADLAEHRRGLASDWCRRSTYSDAGLPGGEPITNCFGREVVSVSVWQ